MSEVDDTKNELEKFADVSLDDIPIALLNKMEQLVLAKLATEKEQPVDVEPTDTKVEDADSLLNSAKALENLIPPANFEVQKLPVGEKGKASPSTASPKVPAQQHALTPISHPSVISPLNQVLPSPIMSKKSSISMPASAQPVMLGLDGGDVVDAHEIHTPHPKAQYSYGRQGLVQPIKLQTFTADEKGEIGLFEYVEQMRTLHDLTQWPADIILQRVQFTLGGIARVWHRRYLDRHPNAALNDILDALVLEFSPIADASLRNELRSRVQKSEENVAQFYYALISLADKIDQVAPKNKVTDAALASQMLDGLLPVIRPIALQQLHAKLGRQVAGATLDQVREAAEAAESIVVATDPSRRVIKPSLSQAFPTRSVNVVAAQSLNANADPYDLRNYTSGNDDANATSLLMNELQNLAQSVNEIRNSQPFQRGGYNRRPQQYNRDQNKPPSDCKVCSEAGITGDIRHWHADCPILRKAITDYQNMNKPRPPPPPHAPSVPSQPPDTVPLNRQGNTQH